MKENEFTRKMFNLFADFAMRKLDEEDIKNGTFKLNTNNSLGDLELDYRYNKIKSFCKEVEDLEEYKLFKGDFDDILNKMKKE